MKNETKIETILKEWVDFLRVRIASPPADIKRKGRGKEVYMRERSHKKFSVPWRVHVTTPSSSKMPPNKLSVIYPSV